MEYMNKTNIKTQIKIAVSLLGSSMRYGYGNGKITHSQRDFIIQTVTEILDKTINALDQRDVLIIPKNTDSINPPDEM